MRAVLDTSILIADHIDVPDETAISIVSIAEMQFGVLVAKTDDIRARRLARLSALQATYDPLPVDGAVAASYAELAAATRRAGRKAGTRTLDLLIAATAHAHDAVLVTSNPKDVKHLSAFIQITSP